MPPPLHAVTTPVGSIGPHLYTPVWVGPSHSLFELLNEFQTGSCHMAFVSKARDRCYCRYCRYCGYHRFHRYYCDYRQYRHCRYGRHYRYETTVPAATTIPVRLLGPRGVAGGGREG